MVGLICCKNPEPKPPSRDTVRVQVEDTVMTGVLLDSTLSDGTQFFYREPTKFHAVKGARPMERTYELDGEVFLMIRNANKKPFIIRTRQLIITVLSPYARLHIDALASSPGEQADLLEGQVKVSKAYHSTTDNEPETLRSGDMVMINRDIDLMEKETLDPAERKAVEKKFPKVIDSIPHN
jgi:ferric-dicitrate binding protein FerR (iron transport regulator)